MSRLWVLPVALLSLLASCSSQPDTAPPAPSRVSLAARPATVRVTPKDIYQTVRLEGVVESYDPVQVNATQAGQFHPDTAARNGRVVSRRQIIGRITWCPPEPVNPTASPTPSPQPKPQPSSVPDVGKGPVGNSAGAAPAACTLPRQSVVRAPTAGVITGLSAAVVEVGAVLATVQRRGFHLKLQAADPTVLYRFVHPPRTGRAELVGGPAGFTVTFEALSYDKSSSQVTIYAAVPASITAFAGLHAVVVFVTGVRNGVLTLPISAVHGTVDQGEVVTIDAAGHKSVATVAIHAADDVSVEVSGLPDRTDVVLYPLESDFGS